MNRWRVVDEQNGNTHISTVVLSETEAYESLWAEETLHRMAGWTVTRGIDRIVCRKATPETGKDTVRVVRIQGFDPMLDVVSTLETGQPVD